MKKIHSVTELLLSLHIPGNVCQPNQQMLFTYASVFSKHHSGQTLVLHCKSRNYFSISDAFCFTKLAAAGWISTWIYCDTYATRNLRSVFTLLMYGATMSWYCTNFVLLTQNHSLESPSLRVQLIHSYVGIYSSIGVCCSYTCDLLEQVMAVWI